MFQNLRELECTDFLDADLLTAFPQVAKLRTCTCRSPAETSGGHNDQFAPDSNLETGHQEKLSNWLLPFHDFSD